MDIIIVLFAQILGIWIAVEISNAIITLIVAAIDPKPPSTPNAPAPQPASVRVKFQASYRPVYARVFQRA